MKFTYIGNPKARDDLGSVTIFGHTFPLNVPVDVQNERAISKLKHNNHFRAEAEVKAEAAAPAPESVAVVEAAPAPEAPAPVDNWPRKARKVR